jgi:hypothetical protein
MLLDRPDERRRLALGAQDLIARKHSSQAEAAAYDRIAAALVAGSQL